MFSWLFGKKKTSGIYEPKERFIFSYWNGEKQVLADPLELYRNILMNGAELAIDIQVSRSKSKDAFVSHQKLIAKLRELLKVKHVSEGGLTESELLETFDSFMKYCENIKKNSKILSTTSNPSPDSEPVISPQNQPTSNISQSGSTENVQSTGEPVPSQLELE